MTGRAGRDARLRKVRLILSEGSLTDRRVRTAGEQITRVSLGYRNAVRIRLAGLVVTRCLDELHIRVGAVTGLVGNASMVGAAIDRVRGRREGVAVLRTRTYRHLINSRVALIGGTAATSRGEYERGHERPDKNRARWEGWTHAPNVISRGRAVEIQLKNQAASCSRPWSLSRRCGPPSLTFPSSTIRMQATTFFW